MNVLQLRHRRQIGTAEVGNLLSIRAEYAPRSFITALIFGIISLLTTAIRQLLHCNEI
jgi:uncharacterized membrane protein